MRQVEKNGFSKENRVRLIYLLYDQLEGPRQHPIGGYIGGEEFFKLDEMLRFRLGRLALVPGMHGIGENLQLFIQSAPEDELLDLIGLMPDAKQFDSLARKVRDTMNAFLNAVGSPARFEADGTFNRDGFEIVKAGALAHLPKKEELDADLQRLLSQADLFSVIVVDLDGFKAVNDRRGHDEGDLCLQAASVAIAESIARKGKIYRYREGDEFAVILRNTTTAEAQATAERIRMAIESRNPGADVKVTASIGVVSSEESALHSAEKLLEAADEAMYVSKYTTKNCVTARPIPAEVLASAREKRGGAQGR